jgi:glycosyltransferase involved in cell wall biosynthesis
MRVLLAAHRYPPDGLAGVERSTEALARHLRAAGDEVSVVAQREGADEATHAREEVTGDGVAVTRIVTGPRSLDQHLRGAEATLHAFTGALLRARPEVVHVHHVLFLGPRVIDVARRLGAAVVVTFHDFFFACPLLHLQKLSGDPCEGPHGGLECATTCFAAEPGSPLVRWTLRAAYFRRLLQQADALVAPSRWMASRMEELTGLGPVEPVPHPVEAPATAPGELAAVDGDGDGRPLVVATLGTVVEHKGLGVVIDALRHAAPALGPVELRVAGATGNAAFALGAREALEGVDGVRARFLGPYAVPDLDWILDGVDAVLVPSLVPESFSLVAREAHVRGVPVVATRLGALEEAVRDGHDGLLVEPGRYDELARALRRLATDAELRARLRQGAREARVVSPAEHVDALHAVYQRALATRLAARPPGAAEAADLDALEAVQASFGFAG